MALRGVVIDAGHGGDDPGASKNGIIEKDLTLEISKELADQLSNYGIPVYLTRVEDETINPTERVNRILNAFGNNDDVIVISNHINAGGGDGAEVIYALRNSSTLSNIILEQLQKEGQNVRKAYQRRLGTDTSKDYYFIHRDTGITQPVIIEYGFLDSTEDDVSQLKNNYKSYANAVARAILEYAGIIYDQEGTYTVKAGDSLWSIAKKYNTTVDEIKKINNLQNNLLSVGQILKIPVETSESEEYKIYIVKKGDTLYSIARNNNITVDELIAYNNLKNNSLSIGQQLLIPITIISGVNGNYDTYTVKKGDSLYKIAKDYGLSVEELKRINNLQTSLLNIGQVLKIPKSETVESSNYIEYVVKAGDSLYKIANNYNIDVDDLKKYNNLDSNLLSIGQIIRIPLENNIYVVKAGDSLYSIAKNNNTTVEKLKSNNNLTSNLLSIGQILII